MKSILIAFMLIFFVNAYAQTTIDDVGDGDGTVPVDGGLSLLLAAGAAYGIQSMRKRAKREGAD